MGGWISVEDAMPPYSHDGVAVIVCVVTNSGDVVSETDVWLRAPEGRFDFWGDKVTHWQPLPEPPK